MAKSEFRLELEAAVNERHCADHPMWNRLAAGELGRRACMGWAVEHYHWISTMLREATFSICAKAPDDVIEVELENFREEEDPDEPHMEIVLKFAKANGADLDEVRSGEGLPTTRSWSAWLRHVAREEPWHCGVAAIRIGTESQSPRLYSKVLPSLRNNYRYDEEDIKHFWLHSEVDIEHGDRGFEVLERHCSTREMKDAAIRFARESARMRWFYFDGIHLHYELGYALR